MQNITIATDTLSLRLKDMNSENQYLYFRFRFKLFYDLRSVGQSVLVLGPPWLDFYYCRTFAVFMLRGPGSIPGTTRKKVVGLERCPLSLVSTTEELLDRKVAAPV
jgi:hypothetical protein